MKKKAAILIIGLVASLSFVGCGRENQTVSKKDYQTDISVNNGENDSKEENTVDAGFSLMGYNYEGGQNGFYIVSTSGTSLYGLVNSKGEFVIPAEYDDMKFGADGIVCLKVEGKWGVYNTEGKEVLPFEYDELSAGVHNYYVKKDGVDMVVDSTGKVVKQLEGTMSYNLMIGDLYLRGAKPERALSYCDLNGNDDLANVEYFEDAGLYRVSKVSNFSDFSNKLEWETVDVIDESGSLLYEMTNKKEDDAYYTVHVLNSPKICSIERIDLFGYASDNNISTSSGECYLYNLETKERDDTVYEEIGQIGNDKIYGRTSDRMDIFNLDGKLINSFALSGYEKCSWVGKILVVKYGETYRIYNSSGEEVTGGDRYLDYDTASIAWEYVKVKNLSGQWGVLDENGKEIIPFGFIGKESDYNGQYIKNECIVKDKLYLLTGENNELNLFVIK